MSAHEQVVVEERAAQRQLRNLDRARRAKAQKARERKRNRTARLRELSQRMDRLGVEYRTADQVARRAIRKELRDLNAERMTLEWGG